jgi:hypothetical protein
MAFVAMASVLLTFGALFLFKGGIAAIIPSLFAILAIVFRTFWPMVPYLFTVAYLLFVPEGVPGFLSSPSSFTVRDGPFRISDFLIIPCVLASLLSVCRFIGVTRQALPYEPETSFSKEYGNVRRPGVLVTDQELKTVLWTLLAATAVGQLMWFLLSRLQFDFSQWFLVTFLPRFGGPSGIAYPEPMARGILLVVSVGVSVFVLRLASWYWGLMQLTPDEARAIITDGAWHEARHELCALERKRAVKIATEERKAMFKHQTQESS